MAEFGFELEDIARLVELVETRSLTELVVEEDGVRVVIKGATSAAPLQISTPALPMSVLPAQQIAGALPSAPVAKIADNRVAVESPVVGVFYRASSPDQPEFASVGDHVDVDQTVGLIEAMKVFSEVKSEISGIVVDLPVESGTLVKVGQALVYIKPD